LSALSRQAVLNKEIAVAVLDSYCPHHAQFQLTPNTAHKVTRLVPKLHAEKAEGLTDKSHPAIEPSAYRVSPNYLFFSLSVACLQGRQAHYYVACLLDLIEVNQGIGAGRLH
jgi:hypothetical protein